MTKIFYETSTDYDKLIELMQTGAAVVGYVTRYGVDDVSVFLIDEHGRYVAGNKGSVYAVTYKESFISEEKQVERYKQYLEELKAEYILPKEVDVED